MFLLLLDVTGGGEPSGSGTVLSQSGVKAPEWGFCLDEAARVYAKSRNCKEIGDREEGVKKCLEEPGR